MSLDERKNVPFQICELSYRRLVFALHTHGNKNTPLSGEADQKTSIVS